jgi:uncharacterized protein YacL
MKKFWKEFLFRGLTACGLGPIVLAVLYLILYHNGSLQTLAVEEVCVGIFSLTALAFVAGGMNMIYRIERLPLMVAILIHGCVLYVAYLLTYLVNNWLERSTAPILIFTGIFIFGYLAIWAVIYCVIKKNTDQINRLLKEKQQKEKP